MSLAKASTKLSLVNANQLQAVCNIHKFGGSSLATAKDIERAVNIVSNHCQLADVVVVSANGNTTNELFALFQSALQLDPQLDLAIAALQSQQSEMIVALLSESCACVLLDLLVQDITQLSVWLKQDAQHYQNDVLAFGELWSARLFSALTDERVCPSYALDARDFLVIDNEQGGAVRKTLSRENFAALRQREKLLIVTGYICRDVAGNTATLGRNGSDYSATIMSFLAAAARVTLWTDVDGIYSADPRKVPQARKLHRIPWAVAKELGRLGNPILHEKTLLPLSFNSDIATTYLHVASSFMPSVSGTEIGEFDTNHQEVLSFTHLNDLLLVHCPEFIGGSGKAAALSLNAICCEPSQGLLLIPQEQQQALELWLARYKSAPIIKPVAMIAALGERIALNEAVRARFKDALKAAQLLNLVNADNHHSIIAILPRSCSDGLLTQVHNEMMAKQIQTNLPVAGLANA